MEIKLVNSQKISAFNLHTQIELFITLSINFVGIDCLQRDYSSIISIHEKRSMSDVSVSPSTLRAPDIYLLLKDEIGNI